ncbi:hypothetical protein KC19_4G106600 [Ceratodon purpureus]|uniref:Chloroplast envelope membrane protein n=1 Tax=Ceratodon purpureus TaxID=3225 RepID=A0A8T0IAR0_CERPU|nr:hypothetical protein KC19_4G106600 [Ceratodon purpureus]
MTTDLLLTRWGSPHLALRSSHPWQHVRLGDGSIARWLTAGNRRDSHVRRRVKCCASHPWHGDGGRIGRIGRISSGRIGRIGGLELGFRGRRRVKCCSHSWHGEDGREFGIGGGRRQRINQGLRVKCCCCSSLGSIGGGGVDGQGFDCCSWREGSLDLGLGQLGKGQGRRGSEGGFCSRRLRRGVRARAGDGPGSWFRNFLFESIDASEFEDGGEDLEEGEIEEEEDEVEFEPRLDWDEVVDGDADAVSGKGDEIDQLLEDDSRFFRWKLKNDARNEVRDFQASGRDPDSKDWEDWLDDSWNQYEDNLEGGEDGWYEASPNWDKDGVPREPPTKPERGMKRTIKELFFRIFEPEDEVLEDLQFEERVFRFTSRTTAKFVAVLIVVPVVTDYLIHDFVLVPFLGTYVEKVPLAAKVLDIRESQKLKIIESLKLERQRLRFEAEIGKAPPLSDDEMSEHIREEALELREEYKLENRQAFASLWSDFVAGLAILLLLVFNPQKVAIMRLTGERLFTNISDTGKAFIIILLTDIFLGYHSESGWETVSEMVLEHYGIEVSQAAIYIFVAIVPVTIDACFKLWVFRFFRTLSPSASATFREMQRH